MQPIGNTVSKRDFDKSITICTKDRRKETLFFITRAKYNQLLSQVKAARKKKSSELHPRLAQLVKRYDVIKSDGVERLAVPNSTNQLIYIPKDELYSVISRVHIETDHGKIPEMTKCLKSKYKNVAAEAIAAYLKLCQKCKMSPRKRKSAKSEKPIRNKEEEEELKENKESSKRKKPTVTDQKPRIGTRRSPRKRSNEGIVVPAKKRRRPRPTPEPASTKPHTFGTRTAQKIDFIEMMNDDDCDYNYIVLLRESTTKFVHMRPLMSRCPRQLADILFPIFICFGTPSVLLSSNSDFIKSALEFLYDKHPTTPKDIVVEATEEGQLFADIETLMLSWVCQNSNERWYNGLRFIQYIANLTFNEEIGKTPFEAMFGRKGKLDVSNLNLPAELINGIRVAEDPEEEVKDLEINEMLEVVMNEDD